MVPMARLDKMAVLIRESCKPAHTYQIYPSVINIAEVGEGISQSHVIHRSTSIDNWQTTHTYNIYQICQCVINSIEAGRKGPFDTPHHSSPLSGNRCNRNSLGVLGSKVTVCDPVTDINHVANTNVIPVVLLESKMFAMQPTNVGKMICGEIMNDFV